jgi:hypothetical protein
MGNPTIYDSSHIVHKHYSIFVIQFNISYNNWCRMSTAEILLIFDHLIRGTRFSMYKYGSIGFRSRAPPPINGFRHSAGNHVSEL